MKKIIRIGTRESQLAVWQATFVQQLLADKGFASELVYIKSEGDIDLVTPLYQLGVQGVFTRTLDAALLSNKIDIAVHSMKDVPTQLAQGIVQAAVLPRASYKDILVYKEPAVALEASLALDVNGNANTALPFTIATSSVRRKAQWLNRYPHHEIDNLRGNVNTRLRKVEESDWNGAIFAAAGLERIGLRPEKSITLDWMLPAPAQGAIMIVCNQTDVSAQNACALLNDAVTALCVKIERDFLKTLMGGCSTPISALAEIEGENIRFRGSIASLNGTELVEIENTIATNEGINFGVSVANQLLLKGAKKIVEDIRYAKQ